MHFALPDVGLYAPFAHGLQLKPLKISKPAPQAHADVPSAAVVGKKVGRQMQSSMEVDASPVVVENSGQGRQDVAKSCPVRLLNVPFGQSIMRPAVHHLPCGHTNETTLSTVADEADVDVTVTVVPSAVAIDALSVLSSTACTALRSSFALKDAPVWLVLDVEMVTVTWRLPLSSRCRRRAAPAHGSESVICDASTPYWAASDAMIEAESKKVQDTSSESKCSTTSTVSVSVEAPTGTMIGRLPGASVFTLSRAVPGQ